MKASRRVPAPVAGTVAAVSAVCFATAALATGCGADTASPPVDDEVTAFCVQFPGHDAARSLRLPAEVGAATDTTLARQLLAFAADGPDRHAPPEIEAAVHTWASALRAAEGRRDLAADPQVVEAVEAMNRWLAAHCPPTTTR